MVSDDKARELAGVHVLVVDDDPDSLDMMQAAVRRRLRNGGTVREEGVRGPGAGDPECDRVRLEDAPG
jgi:hypothetical protein